MKNKIKKSLSLSNIENITFNKLINEPNEIQQYKIFENY